MDPATSIEPGQAEPHSDAADGDVAEVVALDHGLPGVLDAIAGDSSGELEATEGLEGARDQQQLARFLSKLRKALVFWDKLAFFLGSSCMWVCAFWLGRNPHTFWQLYTALGGVLFIARFAVYKARKWHYYLLDFCYASNALLLVHLWLFPCSRMLATITFAVNTGPLTTSIMAFRNSLVYHDMDKVTSLFLHLVPACVSWSQKWFSDTTRFPRETYSGPAHMSELVVVPLAYYLLWAIGYSSVIFVFAAERIRRRGYTTLFTYVTTRKRGTYAAIANKVPKDLQPLVYFVLHMSFCAVSLLLAVTAWTSFTAHCIQLVAALSLAISNGGSYYFEVFAKGHADKVASA